MRRSLFLLATVLTAAASPSFAADRLREGNALFKEGKHEEAARAYESEDDDTDLLTRRFNAGVSWSRAGDSGKAVQRFEEVAAKGEGELRSASLYNAGHASFDRAKAIAEAAFKLESPEEKARKLVEAANAYRAAAQFFRTVDPPDADTIKNIGVTKTALRAILDAIHKLEEEKKKQAEDDALKQPAELLRAIAQKEKLHRGVARALAKEPARSVRLGSRRLRQAEADNRGLAEKLHHYLTNPPAPPQPPAGPAGQPPQPPTTPPSGPAEEEKARHAKAAEALLRAIEAQKDAEIAYSKLDPAGAAPHHTRAVTELRQAIVALPLEVAAVIQEALAAQEGLNGQMEALAPAPAGKPGEETVEKDAGKKSGLGQKLIDTLKDKVLSPLAGLIQPESWEDAKVLADDEDDVVWSSSIIAQAEIKAPEPAPGAPVLPPQGQDAMPDPHGAPQLTPEQAKALSEGLQREGKAALEAATRAKEELASGRPSAALPEGKAALEALQRAAELLPKPPEPPEVRLAKLIERQQAAATAAAGLKDLEEAPRRQAAEALSAAQRTDGKEATGIAEELEKRPDEKSKAAVPRVREGEGHVFASSESLARVLPDEAKGSIERGIKAFEEALAALRGEEQKQDQEQQQDEQQQNQEDQKKDQKKDKADKKKNKENQKPYTLSPREARQRREEMDKKRREEEKKIFSGPSGLTVEKDW